MMDGVKRFLNQNLRKLPASARVLEVGSLDINGSPDRNGFDYTGLDMRPGKNVDVVANSHALPFPEEHFDAVICSEMLEHDDEPLTTLAEIHRVLRAGGMFLVSVPTIYFPKHDFPHDYWRLTEEGLRVWLRRFEIEHLEHDRGERSLHAVAYKPVALPSYRDTTLCQELP